MSSSGNEAKTHFTDTGLPSVSEDAPPWYHLPTFDGMSEDALDALAEHMEQVTFEPDTVIMAQNAPGDFMYVLEEGHVRVVAETTVHDTHFEVLLNAPCVVGEMALITNEPRTATVRTEGTVQGMRVSKDGLEEVLEDHPKAAQILTTIVGRRLLEADTITRVGQYQVIGRLGKGAMATVFEAEQPSLERSVALKMLSHALVNYPGFIGHFRREARLIASLNHLNIVDVHDIVEGYGTHFIVMERLTGHGLDEMINDKVRLEWEAVRRVLIEICRALHYSHEKGLLHRDIKPSNVFVCADGHVKLLDFGIAVQQEKSATKGGRLAGTPYYMAPEQILGRKLDGRADLYSVGILAYQLITHQVPFDATRLDALWRLHLKKPTPDPRRIVADVPDDICEFLRIATSKRKEDRFDDCAEAAEFLSSGAHASSVNNFHLASVSIAYVAAVSPAVDDAIRGLRKALKGLDGVAIHASRKRPRDKG